MGTKKNCDYCEGAGINPVTPKCPTCNGMGVVFANTQHRIILSSLMDMVVLKGEGNHIFGGIPGDLHIEVCIENNTPFVIRGPSIVGRIRISPSQAILGDTIKMKVFGKPLELMIPPGTAHGQTIKQPWAGIKHEGKAGYFNACIQVIFPTTVPAEELMLYNKIRSLEKGRKWPKVM